MEKPRNSKNQTVKSAHHPHKIDDQHRECRTGGGAYFASLLGSDNLHTTPEEGFFVGMVRGSGPKKGKQRKDREGFSANGFARRLRIAGPSKVPFLMRGVRCSYSKQRTIS